MKNSENIHDIHNRLKANIYNIKVKLLSRVRLFATPWAIAYQTPPSMGFSRQEYWSGLPFPFPGDLPSLGIEPTCPALQADSLPLNHQGSPALSCLHRPVGPGGAGSAVFWISGWGDLCPLGGCGQSGPQLLGPDPSPLSATAPN